MPLLEQHCFFDYGEYRKAKLKGRSNHPYEVHVLRFVDNGGLRRYADDEEHTRLLPPNERAVGDAIVIRERVD